MNTVSQSDYMSMGRQPVDNQVDRNKIQKRQELTPGRLTAQTTPTSRQLNHARKRDLLHASHPMTLRIAAVRMTANSWFVLADGW